MPLVRLVGKNSNSFSTFFVSNALMTAIFAELHRRPAVRPDLRGIRDRIIGGGNLHQEAELDRSFFERCP